MAFKCTVAERLCLTVWFYNYSSLDPKFVTKTLAISKIHFIVNDVNIMYINLKWQKMTKLFAYNDRFIFMQIL